MLLRFDNKVNAPHRSTFKNNIVENNGWQKGGYGFYINSPAEDIILEGNTIRNTSGNFQKAAVFIDKNGIPVQLRNKKISGHPDIETASEKSN